MLSVKQTLHLDKEGYLSMFVLITRLSTLYHDYPEYMLQIQVIH